MSKLFLILLIFIITFNGCSITHREVGTTITDMNGYFRGTLTITNNQNNSITLTSIEAAIVQTETELYGTISGVFNNIFRELRITGYVNGINVVIEINEVIGPVLLQGNAESRIVTLILKSPMSSQEKVFCSKTVSITLQ